jgi:heme/copper-type cytochrome/quinol oxidase subunit 4
MSKIATALEILFCAIAMIMTIIGYTSAHGFFKLRAGDSFGITTVGTVEIGFFHEKFDVSGFSDDSTNYSCSEVSSSGCKDSFADDARSAAKAALVFSVVSFVLSFVFVPLLARVTAIAMATSQLVLHLAFIIADIAAYIRLRQFFQYQMNAKTGVEHEYGSECWLTAAVATLIAVCIIILGPLYGLCLNSEEHTAADGVSSQV